MIEIDIYKNTRIAVLSGDTLITTVQDATDQLGSADYLGADKLIIHEDNLDPCFFDLRSGFAGEILQKASNYRKQIAIVGAFEKYSSKALQDFIRECNRGRQIIFASDIDSAKAKLQ